MAENVGPVEPVENGAPAGDEAQTRYKTVATWAKDHKGSIGGAVAAVLTVVAAALAKHHHDEKQRRILAQIAHELEQRKININAEQFRQNGLKFLAAGLVAAGLIKYWPILKSNFIGIARNMGYRLKDSRVNLNESRTGAMRTFRNLLARLTGRKSVARVSPSSTSRSKSRTSKSRRTRTKRRSIRK